jgi:hypothetical protein
MATRDDITVHPGDEQMAFHCRACLRQFTTLAVSEVERGRANGTLDQEVRMIVAKHIRDCTGPVAEPGGKKADRSHKA